MALAQYLLVAPNGHLLSTTRFIGLSSLAMRRAVSCALRMRVRATRTLARFCPGHRNYCNRLHPGRG